MPVGMLGVCKIEIEVESEMRRPSGASLPFSFERQTNLKGLRMR